MRRAKTAVYSELQRPKDYKSLKLIAPPLGRAIRLGLPRSLI